MVFLHIIGIDVVSSMGALPREVWSQQTGVNGPADCIVDDAVFAESTVAAFVCKNPEPGEDNALGEAIQAD